MSLDFPNRGVPHSVGLNTPRPCNSLIAACRILSASESAAIGLAHCLLRAMCHAGSRRSHLLVEAPRSADVSAHSHVEGVAAAVAALPDLAERCSFQQLPPGRSMPNGPDSCAVDTSQVCLCSGHLCSLLIRMLQRQ